MILRMSGKELLGDRPVQRLVMGEWRMRGFSFDPTWMRTLPTKLAGLRGVVATLGLMLFALTSPSHAQAPPLGTALGYGILAGTTVTNVPTSTSVITGNLGVDPGNACTGFNFTNVGNTCSTLPLGNGQVTGAVNVANGAALQAQKDDTTAYKFLTGLGSHDRSAAGRPYACSGRL